MSNSIYTGVFSSGQTLPAAQLNDVIYYLNNHDHGTEQYGGLPAQWIPKIVTTSQKNAISSPSTGLCVWDSTLGTFSYYNGSSWSSLGTSGNSILYGNGNGGTSNVTIGAGLTFAGGSLSVTSGTYLGSSFNANQTYQNTNGLPIMISWDSSGVGNGSGGAAHSYIGSTSSPSIPTGGYDNYYAGGAQMNGSSTYTFYVPVNWYWTVNAETNSHGNAGTINQINVWTI